MAVCNVHISLRRLNVVALVKYSRLRHPPRLSHQRDWRKLAVTAVPDAFLVTRRLLCSDDLQCPSSHSLLGFWLSLPPISPNTTSARLTCPRNLTVWHAYSHAGVVLLLQLLVRIMCTQSQLGIILHSSSGQCRRARGRGGKGNKTVVMATHTAFVFLPPLAKTSFRSFKIDAGVTLASSF